MTLRAAVAGKPITHSLSPVLHNAGYAAAGLDGWAYTAIECAEAELPDLIGRLGAEWAGLSLTMPLKEAALAVAGEVAPVAAAIGAANTLVRTSAGPVTSWRAENTDAPGMVDALRAAGVGGARVGGSVAGGSVAGGSGVGGSAVGGSVAGGSVAAGSWVGGSAVGGSGVGGVTSVAVLGAGGTARAAIAAAAALDATDVRIFARSREAFESLHPAAAALGVPISYHRWEDASSCAGADLVISTVPKGVADALRPAWRRPTVLFDVIYDPWPTALAAGAAGAECVIVSGLDLLLYQAARQFQLFTGVPAPVEAMRAALHKAAKRC